MFDQTRCSRTFACRISLNNRESVKAEAFEKRVFEKTAPLNEENEGGIFFEQPLVGTVGPPQ